jgi:hypothetical protein
MTQQPSHSGNNMRQLHAAVTHGSYARQLHASVTRGSYMRAVAGISVVEVVKREVVAQVRPVTARM